MSFEKFEKRLNDHFNKVSISVSEEDGTIYVEKNPTRLKYNQTTADYLDNEAYIKQNIDLIKYFYFDCDTSELKFLKKFNGS